MFFYLNEKRNEKKHWEMWLMKYQYMDNKTFKPFTYKSNKIKEVSKRSTEEILEDARQIRKSLGKAW
jgi:transposase-like protein